MRGDRELAGLRARYYGLLARLLWREPEAGTVAGLAEGLEVRRAGADRLEPLLARGWAALGAWLERRPPDTAAAEFTRLFIGPPQPRVHPYESHYLTGKLFQAPLAEVRAFLRAVGLERAEGLGPEPEDHLAFELDIVHGLLARQLAADTPAAETDWLEAQAVFLRRHLLVWGPACARDLQRLDDADFYRGVGLVLEGFLALEAELLHEAGPGEVETLQAARRRHHRRETWRGPLVDAPEPGRLTPARWRGLPPLPGLYTPGEGD